MTSQLKKTRTHKQELLRQICGDGVEICQFKIGRLDRIDFRVLKDIAKKLNEAKKRAAPAFQDTNKNVSSERKEKMP